MGFRTLSVSVALVLLCAGLLPLGAQDQWRPHEAQTDVELADDRDDCGLDMEALLGSVGPSFTENRGQLANADVRFYAQGDTLSVGLTRHGAVFTVNEPIGPDATRPTARPAVRTASFTLSFEGSGGPGPRGVTELGHRTNVFRGSDPSGWVTGARSYSEVRYDGLYPGVDLSFHFRDGMLKYDLAVGPGAAMDRIRMRYGGLDGVSVDGATGDLLLDTALGTLRDSRPVFLQEGLGERGSAPGAFRLGADGTVGFALPDGCDPLLPFVIDPGLVFSTFLGGDETEAGRSLSLDGEGNIYVCGVTTSPDFPVTNDSYDPWPNGGTTVLDIFVTKLDPAGSRLLFSTFVGGSESEGAFALIICDDGGIMVGGFSRSDDFPVNNSFREANGPHGAYADAVLFKLSAEGSALPFSAVWGGEEDEESVTNLRQLADGSIVVAGVTYAWDFPTTTGAFCTTRDFVPDWDMFAMRLGSSLESLVFSTFVGGSARDGISSGGTLQMDMDVDASGNVYLFGSTTSHDFPITQGTIRTKYNASDQDCLVAVLDPTGSRLLRSTLFGGWQADAPADIRVSQNGSIYLGGITASTDLNTTGGALFPQMTGSTASFLAIVSSDLTEVQYCTYVCGGGASNTELQAMAWSAGDELLYLLSETDWAFWNTTKGTFDGKARGGSDYLLMGIWTSNMTVSYASYIGGASGEGSGQGADEMAVDGDGDVIIMANTYSEDFPTTPGVLDRVFNGSSDVAVISIDPRPCTQPPLAPTGFRAIAGDDVVRLRWDVPEIMGTRVTKHYLYWGYTAASITNRREITSIGNEFAHYEVENGKEYFFQLSAENGAGEGPRTSVMSARPLGVPSAPTYIRAVNERGVLKLNWTMSAKTGGELLGYHLLKKTEGASDQIIPLGSTSTSYNDTAVQLGVTYTYRVRAFNTLFNGTWSEPTDGRPCTVPGAPVDLVATGGDRSIGLAWRPPDSDGAMPVTGYLVHGGLSVESMALMATLPNTALMWTAEGLENAVEHFYCVYATNAQGAGPPSAVARAVPRGAPLVPRELSATASDGEVRLSWTAPVSDGGNPITGYRVLMGADPLNLRQVGTTQGATTHTATGLTNGETYHFAVLAFNSFGDGPRTEPVSATPAGPPGPVVNLMAVDGTGRTSLMWQLPTITGGLPLTKVRVYRGEVPDQLEPCKDIDATATEFTDFDVTIGTTYFYTVTAINAVGEGARVEVVSAIAYGVSSVPTALVATAADGRVTLRWGAPEEDGGRPVEGYTVFRGETNDSFRLLVELGDILVYMDSEVVNGKTYYYRVKAVNEAGMSDFSAVVSAMPRRPIDIPGPPTGLSVKVKGVAATLTWTAPSSDGGSPVTGYVILRGTDPGNLSKVGEVGPVLSYTDGNLEKGVTYHYSVVAKNAAGQGARATSQVVSVPKGGGDSPGAGVMGAIMAAGAAWAVIESRRRGTRAR